MGTHSDVKAVSAVYDVVRRERECEAQRRERDGDAAVSFFSASPETDIWPAATHFIYTDAAADQSRVVTAHTLKAFIGGVTPF